jgi:hypothetical protein
MSLCRLESAISATNVGPVAEVHGEVGRPEPERPSPQGAWDIRAATLPLKIGWLQPDDISPAAVFLAFDAANMVTGAEYEVSGGDSAKVG